jgi:hypothetical protein
MNLLYRYITQGRVEADWAATKSVTRLPRNRLRKPTMPCQR